MPIPAAVFSSFPPGAASSPAPRGTRDKSRYSRARNTPPHPRRPVRGLCHQARQVGGDYFDFLDLGQERLGLVIGDVSGKGIAPLS